MVQHYKKHGISLQKILNYIMIHEENMELYHKECMVHHKENMVLHHKEQMAFHFEN